MDLYKARNTLNSGKTIYDIPLRVTFYARVSTDKYEQANSLKNQIDYFEQMIQANKNWTYIPGYIDEGISGTSVNKRDAFLQMIRDAKYQKLDFIITKEISRFSRNTLDSIKYTQELLSYGVGVLFQSDNINTLYPDAELRLTIMSSIAQDEVRKISERVKFGFRRSIENGRVLGNSLIWGYRKEDGKLIIDEEEAVIVRLIFDLYAGERKGLRTIAKDLEEKGILSREGKKFGFTTLKNIISNPKYKGYYCGNKTRIVDYRLKNKVNINEDEWVVYKDEENVPAIVDEEIWERANRTLKVRSEKVKNKESAFQSRYIYSGKIYCGEHGTTFHRSIYKYKTGNKEVWQCKKYREDGRAGCMSPTIYTSELDVIVRNAFEEFIIRRVDIVQRMMKRYEAAYNSTDVTSEIEKKQKEVDKLVKTKDKLLELSIDGKLSNDEFYDRNEKVNAEIEAIRAECEKLKSGRLEFTENEKAFKNLKALISKKSSLSDQEGLGEIVTTALDKIVVHKTDDKDKVKLEIFFKFDQSHTVEYSHKEIKELTQHFDPAVTYDARGYNNRGFADSRK